MVIDTPKSPPLAFGIASVGMRREGEEVAGAEPQSDGRRDMKSSPREIIPWTIAIAACLWAASVSYTLAYSKPPTPAPAKSAYNNQSETSGEKRQARDENGPAKNKPIAPEKLSETVAAGDQQEHRANGENYTPSQWWPVGTNIVIAAFTIILAVVAGIQAYVYWQQWDVMNDTKERTLRAYVAIRITNISPFSVSRSPVFSFECINHGQTPAKDVEFDAIVGITTHNPTELPVINGGMNPKRMDVFPNSQSTNEQRSEIPCDCRKYFTAEEIRQIRERTRFIYIGLMIQYWDVFGKGHQTQAYYMVRGNGRGMWELSPEPDVLVELGGEQPQIGFTIIPGTSKFT